MRTSSLSRWACTGFAAVLWIGCGTSDEVMGDDDDGPDGDASPCVGDECEGPLGEGVATLAGTWQAGKEDGSRDVARFNNPTNVAVAADGYVYVADYDNHLIRVVSPEGDVVTLTEQADLQRPFGLAVSRDGATLYVQTDRNDSLVQNAQSGTIWKVNVATGEATVLVRDIGRPRGIAVMLDGSLALADNQHHTLRVLDTSTGAIRDLAGQLDTPGYQDGTGAAARFNEPYDVAVDADGSLLVADRLNHRIRKVTLAGEVTTVAGTGAEGWADGAAAQATFVHPQGLAIDDQGNLFIADTDNFCIRRLDASGLVTTVAGNREPGFHNGAMSEASFYGLEGIDVDSGGFLFVADGNRGDDGPYHRIRRIMLQ